MTTEVTISQGTIKGRVCTAFDGTQYYSFEGIPYAKPPLGDLRFKAPQPPEIWSGIRDCTKPGNKSAQINPMSKKGLEGSEDCLYLNVYTPSLSGEELKKLPVLFFIHGGRFLVGYGDYYTPDFFMRHDVILVTINYRLNILGFLSLDIPEVAGNAGMKDCVMALKWVQNNIAIFNGDANNVTVFGESGGAAIGAAFLTSNMADGLFHKLIAQSGNHVAEVVYNCHDHIKNARHVASLLGEDIKDKRGLYDFFKSLPYEELVGACMVAESMKSPYELTPNFTVVVEKEFEGVERFWTTDPQYAMKTNKFIKVPTITGSSTLEGAIFIKLDESGNIVYEDDFKYFIPPRLGLHDSDPRRKRVIDSIKGHYSFNIELNEDGKKYQFAKLISDSFFHRDILLFSDLVANYNKETYFFSFHYEGDLNMNVMKRLGIKGTTHGDPIQYQFYKKHKVSKYTPRNMKIIDFFSEAWCNFAKHGKPSWKNQSVEWLPFTPEERITLVIDDEMSLVKNEDWDNYKFWRSICDDQAKL